MKIKKFTAFTLAEVLITLGIIGVVAAMTIPTLINKTQDKEYKTAYKKAYSLASQAWMSAVNDDQIEPRTSWTENATRISNFNAFKTYFKVAKDCNASNNAECWADGDKYFSSNPDSGANAFIDSSGVAWSIDSNSGNVGAELLVDVNGFKKPNKLGQDRFVLLPMAQNGSLEGLPVRIGVFSDATEFATPGDYNSANSDFCPSGNSHPCLYKTWLYN